MDLMMQNTTQPDIGVPDSWPHDFDFRAQYAEQQELLNADLHAMAGPANPRNAPLHGDNNND